jgi:3-dehydroshikimate dehydratase
VAVDPARFTRICPDGAPACQAQPNRGIAPPAIDKVTRNATSLTVSGRVQAGSPMGATIELYGNRNAGDPEGEIFLGETRIRTNGAQTPFTMQVTAPAGSVPTSFTATITSNDGATSEFSRPVGLSD